MKKKILSASIALTMSISIFAPTITRAIGTSQEKSSQIYNDTIALMVDSNRCFVNGESKSVGDVNPIIIEDRTVVPARFLAENLGGSASWDASANTATLTVDDTQIDVPIGEDYILVNGEKMQLDVGGVLIQDRTMLPLRGICEAMGRNVSYDDGMILIGDRDFNERTDNPEDSLFFYSLRYMLSKGKLPSNPPEKKSSIQELAEQSRRINVDSVMVPYSSEKDSCYLSEAKLNIVNLNVDKKDFDTYTMDFDVYNQRCSYGIVEVYDAEGNLKAYQTIFPYEGAMTTNLNSWWDHAKNDIPASFKAIYEYASGNHNYIDYKTQSKVTHINVEVPRNGYMLITSNSIDSELVQRKNLARAVAMMITAVYSTADAYDTIITPDVDVSIEKALQSELENFFIENTEVYLDILGIINDSIKNNGLDPYNCTQSIEQIAKSIYNALSETDFNVYNITQSALVALANQSGLKISLDIKENLPLVGEAFSLMDAMADTFNLTTFVIDFDYSRYTPSTVFTFNESIDYFYYDENGENFDKWNMMEIYITDGSKKIISQQNKELGNFTYDINDDGEEETISVYNAISSGSYQGIPIQGGNDICIYINDELIPTEGLGEEVIFIGVGNLNSKDNCSELYIGTYNMGEFYVYVVRYDGENLTMLDFYDSYEGNYPPHYAFLGRYRQNELLKNFAMGVDGEGTLIIKHQNDAKNAKVVTDKYKETDLWSRKMVKIQ